MGMNPDVLLPGERCASTSNRNFEGRQGRLGRTHLVRGPSGEVAPFPFDAFERHRLLSGLDDIGLTLEQEAAIAEYEQRRGLARV